MYTKTKISKGNQIIVPTKYRKKYKLKPGDILNWYDTEDGIYLKIEKNIKEKDIIGIIKPKKENKKPKEQKGLDHWR